MASWLGTEAPVTFDSLAMPEEIRENLNSYSTSFQSPHLFISGPIGVGKTTAWKLVARQLLGPSWKSTTHVLQGRDLSMQRGAMSKFEKFLRPDSKEDTISGRMSLDSYDRNISSKNLEQPPPSGYELKPSNEITPLSRLIIIEDIDYLGKIRQSYLRRMMETTGQASRFILIATAPSRVISALRSRCQMIRIPSTNKKEIILILQNIASKNNFEISDGVLQDITYVAAGNLKKAIFILELLSHRDLTEDRMSVDLLVKSSTIKAGRNLIELALRGKVVEWKWTKSSGKNQKILTGALSEIDKLISDFGMEPKDIISQIHEVLISRRMSLPPKLRAEMLDALSLCDSKIQRSMYPRIHFEKFLHSVSESGKIYGMTFH